MTDTHVDMKYAVGAVATGCREPLCCRENQNKPNKQSIAAGPWGAYNHCDIPWNTVRDMLETLAGRHKVLYILKTTRANIVQNYFSRVYVATCKGHIFGEWVLYQVVLAHF